MDASDRHNGQRDERPYVRPSVRPSLRWSLTLSATMLELYYVAIGKDLRTVCEVMQAALNRVQRWCEDHGLSVNPDKTEMVLFTRKRTLPGLIPIVFFSKELERTNKVKYLGVVLDIVNLHGVSTLVRNVKRL